nr:hypothetical protein CFP56_43395 [Quercus suber]
MRPGWAVKAILVIIITSILILRNQPHRRWIFRSKPWRRRITNGFYDEGSSSIPNTFLNDDTNAREGMQQTYGKWTLLLNHLMYFSTVSLAV